MRNALTSDLKDVTDSTSLRSSEVAWLCRNTLRLPPPLINGVLYVSFAVYIELYVGLFQGSVQSLGNQYMPGSETLTSQHHLMALNLY